MQNNNKGNPEETFKIKKKKYFKIVFPVTTDAASGDAAKGSHKLDSSLRLRSGRKNPAVCVCVWGGGGGAVRPDPRGSGTQPWEDFEDFA